MDWIQMAQDKDHWLGPVNTVMKLRVRVNIYYPVSTSCCGAVC